MNKKQKIYSVVATVIGLCCVIAFLPIVREKIVNFVELNVKHESIDEVYWLKFLFGISLTVFVVMVCTILVQITVKGYSFYTESTQNIKTIASSVFTKKNGKLFIYSLLFLLFCYYPLIHANVYQVPIDDLRRTLSGTRDFIGFNRYIDEFGGMFVHTSTHFMDIAPLTQFIGIGFLALIAVLLAGLFTDFNITFLTIAAAIPAVLSPWFLSDMTYRYDSPYMALSLLAEVIPFVFASNMPAYIVMSVLGNLVMCTTYQSSAGIYVIITIALAFFWWVKGKKESAECWKFIGISALCFLITLGLFKIGFVPKRTGEEYVNTNMLPISSLISGTITNIGMYLQCLVHDLGHGAIAVLFPVIVLFSLYNTTKTSKRNKIITLLLSVFLIVFAIAISFGVYLALEKPLLNRRAFTCVGFAISVTALLAVSNISSKKSKYFSFTGLFVVFFAYCFVAFSFMYGNAQSAQKMYTETRTNTLIADLNKYCTDPSKAVLQFKGNIGWAPGTTIPSNIYPLIREDMSMNLDGNWGCLFIMKQHGYGKFSAHELEGNDYAQPDLTKKNLPLLVDTGLHTIYGDGTKFLIVLKPYIGK